MLPAVEASVWASGSQVWNGKIGNFMAKLSRKAAYSQSSTVGSMLVPSSEVRPKE